MKEEIMQKMVVVLNAMNSISVSGKQNLANLSGCIAVIEEITDILGKSDIVDTTEAAEEK